jgi:hypothetical protein
VLFSTLRVKTLKGSSKGNNEIQGSFGFVWRGSAPNFAQDDGFLGEVGEDGRRRRCPPITRDNGVMDGAPRFVVTPARQIPALRS